MAEMEKSHHQAGANGPNSRHQRANSHSSKNTFSSSSPAQQLTTEPSTHVSDSNNATSDGDASIMDANDTNTTPAYGAGRLDGQTEEEQDTAAQRVFRTSEIVEVILDDLTPEELFQAVRINRTFLDIIAKLPKFRQEMFLSPVKVYNNAEWSVDAEEELPEPVKLNPLIASDDWEEDFYFVEMHDVLGLDESIDRCAYIFGNRIMPKTGMKCFSFIAYVTSKEKIVRLGLGLPGPLTRTFLTQPAFRSGLLLKWPSQPRTEMTRITGVATRQPVQEVLARVDVMPCCIGDRLAVVRAVAANEPCLDDWVRVFAGEGRTTIEVDRTIYPPEIQVLMCGNPTYMHFWYGRGD